MDEFLIFTGMLVAIAVLIVVIILLLANLGAYFTKIPQSTTIFINVADKLRSIWPNVEGFRMSKVSDPDGRHWLIPETNEEKQIAALFYDSTRIVWFQKWLWKTFGVRFMSFVWPHTHRHTFDIRSRKRLLEGADAQSNAPLKARVVNSPSTQGTVVDSLLFLVPRPVYLEGIQLAGDNSRINLLLLPIYRQVIPAVPVYDLKGDFFTQLDAAIEAVVVDFFASHRVAVYKDGEKKGSFAKDSYIKETDATEYEESPLTYDYWLKLSKAGEESPLAQRLRSLNVSKTYRERLGAKRPELVNYINDLTHGKLNEIPGGLAREIPSGIIQRFGFALVSFRIVDWEPHGDTADLAKALLAKETERHTAEGVRQKAEGERDAILAKAAGESSRYERLVTALVEKGVTPDVAAEVVRTQLRTENIGGKDSKITTYVEGGSSSSVMVGTSSQKSST